MFRVSTVRWRRAVARGAFAALLALTAAETHAQDVSIAEIKRKAMAGEPDNGFCAVVPWAMTNDAGEHRFLENAVVGSAEAARFAGGACSYTYVTETYPGANGKCLRYTWWACAPGKTCASGETVFCKNANGGFTRQ
jgi:hypothetical protein